MEKSLKYSQRAIRQIKEVWQYMEENYSEKSADNFLDRIDTKMERIRLHPETGHLSIAAADIRYARVGDYHRLYYRITARRVTVLALFDTRQDPSKRPY